MGVVHLDSHDNFGCVFFFFFFDPKFSQWLGGLGFESGYP